MVRLEATRESKTFTERIKTLTNYITPFKQMWPFYWLKAAAVRDPQATIWQMRYFSLVGRWNDAKPISKVWDRGNAVVAFSQLVGADRAWEMLTYLQTSGTVSLLSDVTVTAKPTPDMTLPTAAYWQERISFQVSRVVAEVMEPVDWRYLFVSEKQSSLSFGMILPDDERYIVEDRIRRAVQEDLDEKGLNDFAHFTSTRLGLGYGGLEPTCSINDFFYQFDLPLALRIERGIPDRSANTLPLTIYCRRPLMLENLKVGIGDLWLPDTEVLPVSIEASVEEGWSVGEIKVPYDSGKVWLKFDNLIKALSYDMPNPTRENQTAEILGHIYSMASPSKGKEKWKKHLLDEDGASFEIALLNAIARFGIPILFAGQLQTGGTATPGYDLVALNHAKQRVVLISAKGSTNNPSQEDCQKLLDAVDAVQEMLPGWYVSGILACHATDNKLGLAKMRNDLVIWSREDLEMLFQADKREVIEPLLWTPPDTPTVLEQALRSIKGY